MCAHKNLEYSEEFQAVRCKDCGRVWHDREPVNIINFPTTNPNTYPVYIPQPSPNWTPIYPLIPPWPIITCKGSA